MLLDIYIYSIIIMNSRKNSKNLQSIIFNEKECL